MMSRRSTTTTLLAVIAITTPIAAAAPPARISHLTDRASFTEAQRREVAAYSEHYCRQLQSGDPLTVDTARAKLIEPLRGPVRIGEVFRFEYTRAALAMLEEIADGANPQAAISALQVMALLGTPRALEAIVDRASIEAVQDLAVRLWAAKAVAMAVELDTLPDNDVNRAVRQLGHAAGMEPDWLVLRRQFEAISAVANPAGREVQVTVLEKVTDRMAKEAEPSELMQAVYPAVKLMLDEYLRLQPQEQEAFGKPLAPILCNVCTVADKHWDKAQQDATAKQSYGGAVHISENLLKLINDRVNTGLAGPRTKLGPAWRDEDKSRFRQDHEAWRTIVSRPPYNKR